MELLTTPNFSGAIQDVVTQYWNTPSMTVDDFVEKVDRRHARRELRLHASPRRSGARHPALPGLEPLSTEPV